jgi:hypothetical protein
VLSVLANLFAIAIIEVVIEQDQMRLRCDDCFNGNTFLRRHNFKTALPQEDANDVKNGEVVFDDKNLFQRS